MGLVDLRTETAVLPFGGGHACTPTDRHTDRGTVHVIHTCYNVVSVVRTFSILTFPTT